MTTTRERMRVHTALQRAKQAGTIATLTMTEWSQSVTDFYGLCAYCLQRPYEVLEHFIPVYIAGTHVKNCIPACGTCNRQKHDHSRDEVITIFGQEIIDRIQAYLEARIESPDKDVVVSDKHPHSLTRWSTRKKTVLPFDQLRPSLPAREIYPIDALFESLTCTFVDLARIADIHMKTLTKIRYGIPIRVASINKLLLAMSRIYGRDLTIRNVTGINVMVNKRLVKKEEKQKQAA